jgi:hypothetical protein
MGLYPKAISEYLAQIGIPRGPYSNVYIVDPANGSDSNTGTTFAKPLKSVEAAYDLCTTNQHDTILMVASSTSNTLSAAMTWSKNFVHLVGMSNNMPGIGQRCGIVGSAASDLATLVTFSGIGCIVRNIRFYNGGDSDADKGAVVVSGSRNEFTNCLFVAAQHLTPAARAGSYSLKVTGSENLFDRCCIGYDSILRGAGEMPELWLATGCSKAFFRNCMVLTMSDTATASPVKVDATNLGYVEFENCIFVNTSTNWGTSLTDCFTITATGTHYIGMRGFNQLVGITGWADTPTHMYMALPASANTGGTNTAPTT